MVVGPSGSGKTTLLNFIKEVQGDKVNTKPARSTRRLITSLDRLALYGLNVRSLTH
jgi:ABC-type lipoprotein export system ATPase subunit